MCPDMPRYRKTRFLNLSGRPEPIFSCCHNERRCGLLHAERDQSELSGCRRAISREEVARAILHRASKPNCSGEQPGTKGLPDRETPTTTPSFIVSSLADHDLGPWTTRCPLARIFHESRSGVTATVDVTILRGVLDTLPYLRTGPVSFVSTIARLPSLGIVGATLTQEGVFIPPNAIFTSVTRSFLHNLPFQASVPELEKL